ncbi:MAG TPA: DUF4013 domain-containing protein [Pyrinomonadaceae bacterium]|jgi:hypothetical protein
MNWIKGFTYIFEDRNWFGKVLVGSLLTSIPVAEAISNGYQIQVIENLRTGNTLALPEWSNMNKMLGRGFQLWLAVNLFYIPSIIISVVSWFLGIPFLLGMIANFIASSSTDNVIEKHGISYALSYIIFPFIQLAVSGIAVFLGSIALPAVFFFVPAMALRCQETGSFFSTLNIFAHIRFVWRNLGDYVVSRTLIAAMLVGMHIVASALGGATFWIAGLGFLLAWFVGAAGRFWSRLAWSYFLANMRMKEFAPDRNLRQINQIFQNPQPEMPFAPINSLTPKPDKYHYWGNS